MASQVLDHLREDIPKTLNKLLLICTKQFFKNSIFGLNSVLGRISKAKPETETEIRPKTECIGNDGTIRFFFKK